MKLLVTGSHGYLGTPLVGLLRAKGHDVVGLDTGYYLEGWLYSQAPATFPTIDKDIRQITEDDLEGFDGVVHLAELSNDPLGQMAPEITFEINHRGSVALAEKCKRVGIQRFVYASSCSVYGVGNNDIKTEQSPVNPQTTYADCKVRVERDVAKLADDQFSPTFLRNATAFGPSPRMRFDIVLNNLSGLAWTTREIRMTSDGTPWRPLVHVLDIGEAVACTLSAPRELIHNEVFNVGANSSNYQVREIAEIVAETFTGCRLTIGRNDSDNRSYRVAFDKIHERLPGFRCQYDAKQGAQQLYEVFQQIDLTSDIFTSRAFTRLKQIAHLRSSGQLDADLYWARASAFQRSGVASRA